MTREYFKNNAIMMVELDGDYGKFRQTMKGSEVDTYIERMTDDSIYFSDLDYAGKQEDPEIKRILDEAWKNFRQDADKYGNYDRAIQELLEDDEPKKKTWTEEQIKNLIQTNDKVLYGALKKLYACQTADEKVCKETRNKNGAGFNSIDAPFLTSVAEFLIRTGFLTDKQKSVTRKKLVKYNKQLTRLANA